MTTSWWVAAVILGWAASAVPAAEIPPEPIAQARAVRQSALRASYTYDPRVRQRFFEEAAADPEVVRMEEFVVRDSKAKLQFARYIERQRRRDAANRPGLANGIEVPGVPGLSVKPYMDLAPSPVLVNRDGGDVARFVLFGRRW